MESKFRKFVLGATALFGVSIAAPAATNAAVIQLGFIIDSSGSIGATDFNTIRTGLANAVNTLIPADGTYEVSVVNFSSNAIIVVDSVVIDNATTRSNVASLIATTPFQGNTTNYAGAFAALQTAFVTTQTVTSTYVNFATDGEPDSQTAAVTARNALIAGSSVDNISIEAIGTGGAAAATFLQNSICSPQPCDTTNPYNFPTQGFYIPVATAADYASAIALKIGVVTGNPNPSPVPEPISLALFGVGILGLGAATRRRSS